MIRYLQAVLIGLDVLCNAILGGDKYETMSCRIGQSIMSGGWASRVPWPKSWQDHFISAVFKTIV